jgi:hypothetical protein
MIMKEIVFTLHARQRMRERGASEDSVIAAINQGSKEPAQRGLFQSRLNMEYNDVWDGRYYGIQQIVPVIDEEENRIVVITVYVFYFSEGEEK